MTLFDVLRYPVSTPPTHEELEALPHDLQQAWYSLKNWNHLQSPARMLQTQWTNFGAQPYIIQDLDILRQMLMEYES